MLSANRRQGDFMRHNSKILILATLSAALSAAAQSPSPSKAPSKQAPATAKAAAFDPSLLHPATLRAYAPDVYEVKFVTTSADFSIKLTRAWAPTGPARYYNLAPHPLSHVPASSRP